MYSLFYYLASSEDSVQYLLVEFLCLSSVYLNFTVRIFWFNLGNCLLALCQAGEQKHSLVGRNDSIIFLHFWIKWFFSTMIQVTSSNRWRYAPLHYMKASNAPIFSCWKNRGFFTSQCKTLVERRHSCFTMPWLFEVRAITTTGFTLAGYTKIKTDICLWKSFWWI